MILIICIACVFAALICYAAVYVGAQADIRERKYWEEHEHELHGYNEFKGYKEREGK